jgi:hypothetical protein
LLCHDIPTFLVEKTRTAVAVEQAYSSFNNEEKNSALSDLKKQYKKLITTIDINY